MWPPLRHKVLHKVCLRYLASTVLRTQRLPRTPSSLFFVLNEPISEETRYTGDGIRYTEDGKKYTEGTKYPSKPCNIAEQLRGNGDLGDNGDSGDSLFLLQRPFLDPKNFLPDVEITDPSIRKLASEITSSRMGGWQQVCQRNAREALVPGSLIEFIANGSTLQLGVVLRVARSRFHHFHNRMVVLAMNNELMRVFPQDITFVANGVFTSDWIYSLGIVENRFNELYKPRTELVQLVHHFLATSREYEPIILDLCPKLYSHIASKNGACPVTLLKLVNTILTFRNMEFESYLHQSAFLMAIHAHLCSDFVHWMVPGCVTLERLTNLSSASYSNSLPYSTLYFATPIAVMSHAHELTGFGDRKFMKFDALVKKTISSKATYDDITHLFTIWEGVELFAIIQMIKYAIIYPHPQLLKLLSNSSILGTSTLTQRSLYDFMTTLGIYDNPQNYATDPLLSSHILGDLDRQVLTASSVKDLKPSTMVNLAATSKENSFVDHFRHLRGKKYFNDHIIYILPGTQNNIGISLEKANSRRYSISIHIIDPATKINPSSLVFVEWALTTFLLKNWSETNYGDSVPLLPKDLLEQIVFSESYNRNTDQFFQVGELASAPRDNRVNSRTQTCMTISFDYNPSLSEPLKNLGDTVSVTFDDISNLQLKKLDTESLELSLLGKSQPGLLNSFILFDRTKNREEKELKLDSDDDQNLNFIQSVLKIHFLFRNRNNATCTRPAQFQNKIQKSRSFNANSGTFVTDLQLFEQDLNHRSTFFKSEIGVLLGSLVSFFCSNRKIPVFFRNQDFADIREEFCSEGVRIKHKNSFFPEFTASSYFQAAFARDRAGYVSTPASIFAFSHLNKTYLDPAIEGQNIGLGLEDGFVNVLNPSENMEAYLNQLQILSYVHSKCGADGALSTKMNGYSHLKSLGYQLHGPLNQSTLNSHATDLESAQVGANYMLHKVQRFWVLKMVERDPACFLEYTCVITRVHEDFSEIFAGGQLVKSEFELRQARNIIVSAYCEELATEVLVLVPSNNENTIGTEVIAEEVVFVDAISNQIILK